MADELTDAELRTQLIAYGEKTIGPITHTTRAIYRKKLNHLKAAERKASKGRGNTRTSNKLTVYSSDSEGEVESRPSAPARGRKSRSTRGKGRGSTRVSEPPPPAATVSQPSPRRSLRSRRSFVPEPEPEPNESTAEEDEKPAPFSSPFHSNSSSRAGPRMASTSLQVSMNNTLGLSRYDQPDSIEVSDSDLDPNNDKQDEVYSDGASPPKVTRSANSSQRSEDSSFFNKTWSRWMGNADGNEQKLPKPRSTSTPEAGRLLRHRTGYGNTTQNNLPLTRQNESLLSDSKFSYNNLSNHVGNHHSKSSRHRDQSAHLSEDEMEREFKTEEDPSSYSYALYISKVLVMIVALFFLGLALVYLTISGPSMNSTSKSLNNATWLQPYF